MFFSNRRFKICQLTLPAVPLFLRVPMSGYEVPPVKEALLQLTEKARPLTRAKPAGSGSEAERSWADVVHRVCCHAAFATTVPPPTTPTLWMFEQFIIALQVNWGGVGFRLP